MSDPSCPHRKTRKRFEIVQHARFLTFSCFHRLPLFTNDAIKDAFGESLNSSRARTQFKLVAWVVMPEHVHLLMVPSLPEFPISVVLGDLKGRFANAVLRRWRELNAPILKRVIDASGKHRFWQVGGGYDRNIDSDEELIEKINYIHDNPGRRKLVTLATDWPWSSARWYAGDHERSMVSIDVNAW